MSEIKDNIIDHKNVCTEVVSKNLCIGCGICAIVCPRENLKIEFNRFGEYNALEIGNSCGEKCNLCLKVCPFFNNKDNEDTLGKKLFAETPGIKHTPETGYYIDSFVGYSNIKSHRENGASGGLATWTLEKLLTDNLVDHVACVSPNDNPEKLFKFKICNTPEEVRECSRSCYYPVETSEVIKHILSHKGRYGIIALPCMCKAVRLAMQLIPKLQRRVKFILGLVCGQTKSKFFAEYVCALGGGDPYSLNRITFRIKDSNRPASDFGMKWACRDRANRFSEGVVFWTEGMNRIWSDRYFTPKACNFCDDVFAELADVCFMDAWLPNYFRDSKGYNIVTVRNKELSNIFSRAADNGAIERTYINIAEVIRSQQGVLDAKRGDLLERRYLAENEGQATPQKRFYLCKPRLSPVRKLLIKLTWKISQESSNKWSESGKSLQCFEEEFTSIVSKVEKLRYIDRYLQMPAAVFRKMRRVSFC
ncbi:MAG TPA: Coenzyme F420 hydrogenase/dehydrogenase, beta subunit C-terminal domain [Sedimentisphaerales bacterium]|nr:Coenzyme F420 hydrogenase/dehydrogenase, beta subunit C-terminal domain [Sedimentisphaerales bacterium]